MVFGVFGVFGVVGVVVVIVVPVVGAVIVVVPCLAETAVVNNPLAPISTSSMRRPTTCNKVSSNTSNPTVVTLSPSLSPSPLSPSPLSPSPLSCQTVVFPYVAG